MAVWTVVAGILCGQAGFAQGPRRRPDFSPEQSIERLAERLDLTEQQKSAVQSYLEDQRSQMEVLRNDTTLTREQRMERVREIGEQTRAKIHSILTVEQQQRAEGLRNEARQRDQERGEDRLGRVERLLELTPDQKTQVQSYLENQRTQLQALRDNSSLTQEQRRDQARAIHQQTQSSIRSLLDPLQQQKLDDLQASQRDAARRGRRRGGPGGRRRGPEPNAGV
jgi:hypothetical protein